jgi:hypothetical protein
MRASIAAVDEVAGGAVMTGERTAHAALVASAKSRAAKFGLGKRIGWRD